MTDRVELYWCLEDPLVCELPRLEALILTHHLRTLVDLEYVFGTPLQDGVKSPPLSTLAKRVKDAVGGTNG